VSLADDDRLLVTKTSRLTDEWKHMLKTILQTISLILLRKQAHILFFKNPMH
jgi:hypothetical protein